VIPDTVLSKSYKFFSQVYFYSVIADAVHNFCHDIYDHSPTVVFSCIPRNLPLLQGGSIDLEQQCLQMYSYSTR